MTSAQREVELIMQARGYVVEKAYKGVMVIKGKWITNKHDIFACDVVAKKAGERTLWIQVTEGGHADATHRKRKLEKLGCWSKHDDVQVWRLVKGRNRHYVVYKLENDWVMDEKDFVFPKAILLPTPAAQPTCSN